MRTETNPTHASLRATTGLAALRARTDVSPLAPEPKSAERPDEEVLVQARAGDVGCFELLMRRHNQRLYRAARAVLRNEDEAEDVVQEAWVRVYEHLGQYRGEASFATWATRIALHEAFRRVRRGARQVAWEDTMAAPDGTNGVTEPRDPERRVLDAELGNALRDEIDALPESLRTVVLLRDVEGLSTAEVASCLEIGESAAKVRLHRGRAVLRSRLRERLDAPAGTLHSFGGARCNRTVARVLQRLGLRRAGAASKDPRAFPD